MAEFELTPEQKEFILVIRSGGTVHGAIGCAHVLRKDVLDWRRDLPHFEAALQRAFAERDWMIHEKAILLVDAAFQALRGILYDSEASPSVRFKAARFIVEIATAPTPQTAQISLECTKMHKSAESPTRKPAQPETAPAGSDKQNDPLPGAA